MKKSTFLFLALIQIVGLSFHLPAIAAEPSVVALGVSQKSINPGDSISWKVKIQREVGKNQQIWLVLLDSQGDYRTIAQDLKEVSANKAEEISLKLVTHLQVSPGDFKVASVCYSMPNSSQMCLIDGVNWPNYWGRWSGSIETDLSSMNFQIVGPKLLTSKRLKVATVKYSRSLLDPGDVIEIEFGLVGMLSLGRLDFGWITPTGKNNNYRCDALRPIACSVQKNATSSGYVVKFRILTSIAWASGQYKINYFSVGSSPLPISQESELANVDSRYWVEVWNLGSPNASRSEADPMTQLGFTSNDLDFVLANAGYVSSPPPTILNVRWEKSDAPAGSFIYLLVDVDGHGRNISSVSSAPYLGTLNGDSIQTYSYDFPNKDSAIINGQVSGNFPLRKSGTFRVGFYVPRDSLPGTYIPYYIRVSTTSCDPKSLLEIQEWYSSPANECVTQGLSTEFANGFLVSLLGNQRSDLALNAQIKIMPPLKVAPPIVKLKSYTPQSLNFEYFDTLDVKCDFKSNKGVLEKIRLWDMQPQTGLSGIRIGGLEPSTEVKLIVSCVDSLGTPSEISEIVAKTDFLAPPAIPQLVLLFATTSQITVFYKPGLNFKYELKTSVGKIDNTYVMDSGKVLVKNLNPSQKISITLKVTDTYGQSREKVFNFQSAKASPKSQSVTLICIKGKLTKKVTALEPVCPPGYKKKA
jgi:hypothetical protein